MRMLFVVALSLCTLFLTSCGVSRVYPSASYTAIHDYVPKPEYRGTPDKGFYLSGNVSTGSNQHFDGSGKDSRFMASFNATKSYTGKYFNAYYGAGLGVGTYTFKPGLDSIIMPNERKTFYTISGRGGINFTLAGDRWDFRLVGFNLKYVYEFGPYQDKLADIANALPSNTSVLVINERSMISPYFNSEALYKIDEHNVFGLEFFYGSVLINNSKRLSGRGTGFGGLNVTYRNKNLTFNVGHETGKGNLSSTRFGIAYKLF